MKEDWTTTENYKNFIKNVKKYGMSKRQWMKLRHFQDIPRKGN
jgi:hypothetical protein